jgi:hypothetical protein
MEEPSGDRTTLGDRWYLPFLQPGAWFWLAAALGLALRAYFVVFTEGTYDVGIWRGHAAGVRELGLIGYYHSKPLMNHPPFIAVVESLFLWVADAAGIPFRVLLRAPVAMFDGGTAMLLLGLLGQRRWRYVAAAAYWLNPLAIILSAYHGNNDSAVAFFVVWSLCLLSKGRVGAAGSALGACLAIKLPGLAALPALFFFIPDWRKRLTFLSAIGATALAAYLPALLMDAGIVWTNVFGYRGQILHTANGTPIWGLLSLISSLSITPDQRLEAAVDVVAFYLFHGSQVALASMLLLAWLRRSCRTAEEVGATIAATFMILYGFTNNWAFQYFAWSVPFWLFVAPWFFVLATFLAGGYIYSLYWFLCGSPWLFGKWDFMGRPDWPLVVTTFRNAAVVFFLVGGVVCLISAAKAEVVRALDRLRAAHRATRKGA